MSDTESNRTAVSELAHQIDKAQQVIQNLTSIDQWAGSVALEELNMRLETAAFFTEQQTRKLLLRMKNELKSS